MYVEEYERIDDAFYREKQVQGWRREKKEALISGKYDALPELALSRKMFPSTSSGNDMSFKKVAPSTSSGNGTNSGNDTEDSGIPTSSGNGTK